MTLKCIVFLAAICICLYRGSANTFYLKFFKQRAIEIIDLAVPKTDCSRHLKAMIMDLFNWKKLWALKMLDSSAKLQSGFLSGNVFHIGNYDGCVNIREDKEDVGIIEGQYCTVALNPAKNSSSNIAKILDFSTSISEILGIKEGRDIKHILRLIRMIYGVCLPRSCNADNIQKLWNYVEHTFRLPVHMSAGDHFCSYKNKIMHPFAMDGIVICVFVAFFVLICFATIYDRMFASHAKDASLFEEILLAFSLRKNVAKILDMSPSTNEDTTFSCISGLKVISMLWIIFGHKFSMTFLSGSINMLVYFEFRKTLSALLITVSNFAVDTFLVISGLLLCYKYLQVRDLLPAKTPFPYFMFYFMRLLRLWPCLIATIFLYVSVLKYLNDGPLWPFWMYKMALSCRYVGWFTALFATNFVEFHYQCIEPTWYLAVDTQLYCIAPLILYFFYKHPKRTTTVLITFSLVSAIYTYYITLVNREGWTPAEGDNSYHYLIYQSTFIRSPPWIFGLLAGAFLYKYQHIRIPKALVVVLWNLVVILFFIVVAANHKLSKIPYSEYNAAIFNATTRHTWALAVCLVIILCALGQGGIVNRILSLHIYQPITKISYSVFLMHTSIMVIMHGGKRATSYHNIFRTFYGYLGDLPYILIGSFLWCLAFESPFINIGKIITRRATRGSYQLLPADDEKRLRKTMPAHQESHQKHLKLKKK